MAFKRRDATLISRIDVSAFVSVMLVLVLATVQHNYLLRRGYRVELPRLRSAHELHSLLREDSIVVTIARDGQVFLGRERVSDVTELHQRIKIALWRGAERRIYIKADGRCRYRFIMEVLDQVRYAEVQDVSFVAEKICLSNSC